MKKQYDWEELLEENKTSDLVRSSKISMPERFIDIEKVMSYLIEHCCFVGLPETYKHNHESFIYKDGVFTLGNLKFYPKFDVNKQRDIQLHNTPQSEIPVYISQELGLIRAKLNTFSKAPYSLFINESMKRHKYFRKEVYSIIGDFSYDDKGFNMWWPYLLWKFSWLLLIYEPENFDIFRYKIDANEKSGKRGLILSILATELTGVPKEDRVHINIGQVFELIIEHQILTEYNYCLSVDKNLCYEDFMNGIIPEKPNNSKLITGFNTTLYELQITNLYNSAKEEFVETDIQNLFDLLTGQDCIPVVWKYYHGNAPNKLALRAFINVVFNKPKHPKAIGKQYFIDKTGKPIELSKPVKNHNYQAYIDDFEKMIKK